MRGGTFRDWDKGGSHVVFVETSLDFCHFTGRAWSLVRDRATAFADAVVDDYGNLVVVGRWS